jgi:hypothetical protein
MPTAKLLNHPPDPRKTAALRLANMQAGLRSSLFARNLEKGLLT